MSLKCIWKCKEHRVNGQNKFGEEENVGEFTLPNSTASYKGTLLRSAWLWCDNRCTDWQQTYRSTRQNSLEIGSYKGIDCI